MYDSKLFWIAIQQIKTDLLMHFDAKVVTIQSGLSSIQNSLNTLLEQCVGSNEDSVQELVTQF